MKSKPISFSIGKRVRLAGSGLKGIIVALHNSTYGVIGNKKQFHGFRVEWNNGKVGICEASDLELIPKRRAA